MAKEKAVSDKTKIYAIVDTIEDFHTRLISRWPLFPPLSPYEVFEICCNGVFILRKLDSLSPSIINNSLLLLSLHKIGIPKLPRPNPKNLIEQPEFHECASVWGKALDLFMHPKGIENWEVYCSNLVNYETEIRNEKENPKKYKNKIGPATKEWIQIYKTVMRRFHDKCRELFVHVEGDLKSELLRYNFEQDPDAHLMAIYIALKQFKKAFLQEDIVAIGPFLPSENDSWSLHAMSIGVEIGSEPGTLEIENLAFSPNFRFTPRNGEVIECQIHYDEWDGEWAENELFNVWSYSTGEHNRPEKIEGKAYLLLKPGIEYLRERADSLIKEALPLCKIADFKHLVDKVTKVARNGKPQWWPGRIQWSYIKELDEVIREFEYYRKRYELEHGVVRSGLDTLIFPKKNITSEKIPSESKSPPLSLKEMAGHFGKNTTVPKITAMIRSGSIKVEKINRQSYYFDLETLPAYVRKKI
ncbi:MAG: hypothetical protein ACYSSP_10865, partial [Planctomycetota bacterium]